MAKKTNIQIKKSKKSGYFGNKIWEARRLEGDEKNKGIKPIKK